VGCVFSTSKISHGDCNCSSPDKNRMYMSKLINPVFVWHAGLAAGVYSGLTYGLREARGCHDWVSATSLIEPI